ncbi:TraR/DksA family transcriptional regulator [Nisaea acidiphila]|uniref:TraR/DksA family transcriptional regulator n=1 Tax=Nisaea acidiphila TaxID=1862145 RepID=A0A9J7AWP5_9PROT|nr:TraR/DksA family transcriptional regulator [Nisaea acidiphila]UUX50865.1 TraR/DksA family transcriptional regulator [Nisaea acidiphila]
MGFDLEQFRERLLARRAEIRNVMEAASESARPVELDQTRVGRLSRMDALQGQAMAKETERRRSLELQRIATALERIEDEEFGYCVSCGEEIPLKRLDLDPAVTTCVDCAAK